MGRRQRWTARLATTAVALVVGVEASWSSPVVGPATAVVPDPGRSSVAVPALVIGHRGAAGYRPESTLAGYALAIRQCADYLEADVVPTRDGRLVVRHDNNLVGTTDVAEHPEFAGRKTTKTVDGSRKTGWFTEDFTLVELRTLRAEERLPDLRPANTAYDGRYPIPTLDEVFDLARRSRSCDGDPIGVSPETKHPTYFASIGLPVEGRLLAALEAHGWTEKTAPVLVQSTETTNLKALAQQTDVPLVQLVGCDGAPYDLKAAGKKTTYAKMRTRSGLKKIARYADAVGFCKDTMIPRSKKGWLRSPTKVIRNAHRAGLTVIGGTFRRENEFLPLQFRSSDDPAQVGDLAGELDAFLDAGMDGFFTDNPDLGHEVSRDHG